MNERELIEQNPWWRSKELIEQDIDILKWKEKKYKWIPNIIEKIKLDPFAFHIISGPRQAGKTTALKLLIKKLLEKREALSLFYFNCENLSDYKELLEILNLYFELRDSKSINYSVIILDEVTLPKEWYRAIKSTIDLGKVKNDVLIITGSTSIYVKREVELFPGRRGKGEDFILLPLSFRGFLDVVDQELKNKISPINSIDEIDKKILSALIFEKELNKYLNNYMEYGGFPLSVGNLFGDKKEAQKTYLSWIKNAVLKAGRSDIVARQIGKVLVEVAQSDVSWEGIAKKIELKSPKTVASYIDLFKSIFAVNILYNIDLSGKKIRFGRNKKIHFRDPLLMELFEEWCLTKAKNKQSALAESLVVEHLIRMFPDKVFFWRNGSEIDAIVLEKGRVYGFEVKWSEKPEAKVPNQIKKFLIITKKEYSKMPLKIPLSVFLSSIEI